VRREQEKLAEQQRQMQQMIREMLAKQRAELEEEMRKRDEALGRKPPAPAPAPAAPVDREVVFWESIKNSANPEDFKAYLAQYPKGAFTALAQTRLNPAPAPEPPAAPTASETPADRNEPLQESTQVAAIAPTPVAAEVLEPRFPKLGDRWQYVFTDRMTRQTRTYDIEAVGVSKDGIYDMDNISGGRVYGPGADMALYYGVWAFSPYLNVFGETRPGMRWDDIKVRNDGFCSRQPSCVYNVRVAGPEKVTTPAGTFDAVRVDVELTASSAGFHTRRRGSFWYADAAKRLVKSSVRTLQGNPWAPDYDLELVSYKLN